MDPLIVFSLLLLGLACSLVVYDLFFRKRKNKQELDVSNPPTFAPAYRKLGGYTPRTRVSKPEPARFDDGPSLLDVAITVAEVEALSKSLNVGGSIGVPDQEMPWEGGGGGFSGAGASGSWDDSSSDSSSSDSSDSSSSDSSSSDSYDSSSSDSGSGSDS